MHLLTNNGSVSGQTVKQCKIFCTPVPHKHTLLRRGAFENRPFSINRE